VIFLELDSDGLTFCNPLYNSILATYREQWKILGTGVEVPAHFFLNHPDPEVCNASVDILTSDDNYVPSKLWEQKEVHVESVEEILAQGVPKAVILYKSNAIKKLIDEQMQRLASGQLTEEEELEATTLINTLNCEKTNISHKVQRTIL
jgi:DNA primase